MSRQPPASIEAFAVGSYYNPEARSNVENDKWDWYHFHRIIASLKGWTFKGYTERTIGNFRYSVSAKRHTREENYQRALAFFSALYRAASPGALGLTSKPVVVPVPSTSVVEGQELPEFWPGRDMFLADVTHPIIRFTDPPPLQASKGGPRHWSLLYPRMVVTGDLPEGAHSAIIADDVVTSGGHVQAVAMHLMDLGVEEFACVCVGKTVDHPVDDPWAPVRWPI